MASWVVFIIGMWIGGFIGIAGMTLFIVSSDDVNIEDDILMNKYMEEKGE